MTQKQLGFRKKLASDIKTIKSNPYLSPEHTKDIIENLLKNAQGTDEYIQAKKEKIKNHNINKIVKEITPKANKGELIKIKEDTYYMFHKLLEPKMGDNTGYMDCYLRQCVGGFKLLKSIEKNYNPGTKMKILVDKKDPIKIPFDRTPPTKEQSECNDLSVNQMLDKQVKNIFPESFGHSHGFFGNDKYYHTLLWKNIKRNHSKLLEEWGLYLSSHADEAGFHYHRYTTYGHLYNVDHADPRNVNIQRLFQTFLLQKNIEIIYCDKYTNLKDIAKEIYNAEHIQ